MSERKQQADDPQAPASGVDATLIDETLRLTVRQRLEAERSNGRAGGETARGVRGRAGGLRKGDGRVEEERRLTSVLGVLLAERVEFVLVGALAAVAQGRR